MLCIRKNFVQFYKSQETVEGGLNRNNLFTLYTHVNSYMERIRNKSYHV
jgi:hypothetical protein